MVFEINNNLKKKKNPLERNIKYFWRVSSTLWKNLILLLFPLFPSALGF